MKSEIFQHTDYSLKYKKEVGGTLWTSIELGRVNLGTVRVIDDKLCFARSYYELENTLGYSINWSEFSPPKERPPITGTELILE